MNLGHTRKSRFFFIPSTTTAHKTHLKQRHPLIVALEPRTLLSGLAWTPGVSLPTPVGGADALNDGTEVLLLGGSTSTASAAGTTSALSLTSGSTAWASAFPIDHGRTFGGAGAAGGYYGPPTNDGPTYGSDVFLYGGSSLGTPTNSMVNYGRSNEGNNLSAPSMSTARSDFGYATDPATGDLYAFGGLGSSGTSLATVERFNTTTGAWESAASLPVALYGSSAASDGAGHLFVFGGDNSAGSPVNSVYRYTIASNTWDSVSSMPVATSYSTAVYAFYGEIYVAGGKTASGVSSDVEWYNPVTDVWTADASLPSAVYGAAGVIDTDGNLEIIGGFDSTGQAVNSVDISAVSPPTEQLPQPPLIQGLNYTLYYNGTPQGVQPVAVDSIYQTPVSGSFTVTYNGSTTVPTNAGAYNVIAYFTSTDPNYTDQVAAGTFTIGQGYPAITLSNTGTHAWTGQPIAVSATEVGIDGVTPVPGSFSFAYNGSTTAPSAPGTYAVVATFTSTDPNYSDAIANATLTISDPTIPTGVKVAGASTTSVTVSWNPVTEIDAGTPTYNVVERVWIPGTHGGKGSGTGGHYVYDTRATGLTGTSATFTGLVAGSSHTYYVTSTDSTTGITSTASAYATGQTLIAPTLVSGEGLEGGAVVSNVYVGVGQTIQIKLLGAGNEPPVYSLVSGPSTMSVDPNTGVITYTPGATEAGNVTGTFKATNSVGSATGTFTFVVLPLPAVTSFQVNDGNPQRSMVNSLTVVFNQSLYLPPSAFVLNMLSPTGGAPTPMPFVVNTPDYGTTYVFTFTDPSYIGGSLPDGTYDLNLSGITNRVGVSLPAGSTDLVFYRLYGDYNGDGSVNGSDFAILASKFNTAATPSDWYLDYDGDGGINGVEFAALANNFNKGAYLPPSLPLSATLGATTGTAATQVLTTSLASTTTNQTTGIVTQLHSKKTRHKSG